MGLLRVIALVSDHLGYIHARDLHELQYGREPIYSLNLLSILQDTVLPIRMRKPSTYRSMSICFSNVPNSINPKMIAEKAAKAVMGGID